MKIHSLAVDHRSLPLPQPLRNCHLICKAFDTHGIKPEQERLSKLYSGSGIQRLPELNPKLCRFYLVSESGIGYRLDRIVDSLSAGGKVTGCKDGIDHT